MDARKILGVSLGAAYLFLDSYSAFAAQELGGAARGFAAWYQAGAMRRLTAGLTVGELLSEAARVAKDPRDNSFFRGWAKQNHVSIHERVRLAAATPEGEGWKLRLTERARPVTVAFAEGGGLLLNGRVIEVKPGAAAAAAREIEKVFAARAEAAGSSWPGLIAEAHAEESSFFPRVMAVAMLAPAVVRQILPASMGEHFGKATELCFQESVNPRSFERSETNALIKALEREGLTIPKLRQAGADCKDVAPKARAAAPDISARASTDQACDSISRFLACGEHFRARSLRSAGTAPAAPAETSIE